MYVSFHPNDRYSVFRLHALKMGNYYLGSKSGDSHDFRVKNGWNAHPACVSILETLAEDRERPIRLTLGGEEIVIDLVIADELFDCLFAYTIMRDHQ